jgi:hypothetical protein
LGLSGRTKRKNEENEDALKQRRSVKFVHNIPSPECVLNYCLLLLQFKTILTEQIWWGKTLPDEQITSVFNGRQSPPSSWRE